MRHRLVRTLATLTSSVSQRSTVWRPSIQGAWAVDNSDRPTVGRFSSDGTVLNVAGVDSVHCPASAVHAVVLYY